jgi:hypothetical protein
MKKQLLTIAIASLLITGCYNIDRRAQQNFQISTTNDASQAKTKCSIKNEEGQWTAAANELIRIHRDDNLMDIQCQNDTQFGSKQIEPYFKHKYIVNNLLADLCTVSCVIDAYNNAFYQYTPYVSVDMQAKEIAK